MISIASGSVTIQTSAQSVPSTPGWMGEITLMAHHLQHQGVLAAIEEQVRFARRRFGRYEVIDFVAVLFGYAVSGEGTLEAFYERLHPFAAAFMALFGRDRLPARSTLSRFLTALTSEPVEALRTLFLEDLLGRQQDFEQQPCGLTDRVGNLWKVFDIDGTREAARQRALPQTPEQPVPQRRLQDLCAAGYTGRKRGEIVRTRTTVLQAHSYPWLGLIAQPRQWGVPQGVAPSGGGNPVLPASAPVSRRARPPAAGWSVWDRSRPDRSARFRVRDAWQRLSGP